MLAYKKKTCQSFKIVYKRENITAHIFLQHVKHTMKQTNKDQRSRERARDALSKECLRRKVRLDGLSSDANRISRLMNGLLIE